jgi:hypothetical protein
MTAPLQLNFPFPSLDFPGRTVLYMHEVAERIGCSIDKAYTLVDDGSLAAVNIAGATATRRELRVPIECWRNFIVQRMTAPMPQTSEFLKSLPAAVRDELIRELRALSPA